MIHLKTKLLLLGCVSFFFIQGQTWTQNQKLVASDRQQEDYLGTALDLEGNYAIIGAHRENHDVNGENFLEEAGSVYIYENINGAWTQKNKVVSRDRARLDQFGKGVAISGDYAAVGSPSDDLDSDGSNVVGNAGAVYIYQRNTGGDWVFFQKIVTADRNIGDQFGEGVAMDGDVLAVGSWKNKLDENGANSTSNAGAVYVFEKGSDDKWVEVKKLVASDRTSNDYLGQTLQVDGNTIVVGTPTDGTGIGTAVEKSEAGSIVVFGKVNGTWKETQKIVCPDYDRSYRFGESVSVSGDYILAGSPYMSQPISSGQGLNQNGEVYVFKKQSDGTWAVDQMIVAGDRLDSDHFGEAVSMSGNRIVVSAPATNTDENGLNYSFSTGAVYVFDKQSDGTWLESKKVVLIDRTNTEYFAEKIALSGDVFLAASDGDNTDANGANEISWAGAAYIFSTGGSNGAESISNDATRVYPNPNTGLFSVTSESRIDNLKIYDQSGRLVKTINVSNTQKSTVVHLAKSGVYFVHVQSENATKVLKAVVVK